jgi:hypothetical protein
VRSIRVPPLGASAAQAVLIYLVLPVWLAARFAWIFSSAALPLIAAAQRIHRGIRRQQFEDNTRLAGAGDLVLSDQLSDGVTEARTPGLGVVLAGLLPHALQAGT